MREKKKKKTARGMYKKKIVVKLIEIDLVMNASRHLLDYHSLVRWVVLHPFVAHARARARLHEESRAESRTLLRLKMERKHSVPKENIAFKE